MTKIVLGNRQARETALASRTLTTASKQTVEISIFAPKLVRKGEWRCRVQAVGTGKARKTTAYGVDSLQALINGVSALRALLGNFECELAWDDGELGDVGLPMQVPSVFGTLFTRRLESLIERQVEKEVSRLESAHRAGKPLPARRTGRQKSAGS